MRLFTKNTGPKGRRHATAITLLAVMLLCCTAVTVASTQDLTEQQYTFALVSHAQPGDTFWDIERRGAEVAAKQHGIKLMYLHGKTPAKQVAKLKNVITQGVDGIALTLMFPEAVKPLVKQAKAAGIPVIGLNSGFDYWQAMDGVLMYIGQDPKLAGNAVGDRLNADGAEKALCVNHQQGAAALAARCHGIAETFNGELETLYLEGFDMGVARSRIMAKLMQDPAIGAVVTLGAPFAPVAAKAVQMGHSKARVMTFDLTPRTAKLIQNGKVDWAIDQQPFLQGYETIELLWLYQANGDTLGGGQAVLTGPAFVDADNIDTIVPYIERGTR